MIPTSIRHAIRLLHVMGMVLFLGSVFTFILISARSGTADLQSLAFGRTIIRAGTQLLTVPGIWILTLSGLFLGLKEGGIREPILRRKALLGVLILANTYLFILPAVHSATELALASLKVGSLEQGYLQAYARESLFGGGNVLLSLLAAYTGIAKAGKRREEGANGTQENSQNNSQEK